MADSACSRIISCVNYGNHKDFGITLGLYIYIEITHKTFSIILLIQKSLIFFTIQNNYVKINIEEHIIVWVILLIFRSFKVSNSDLIKKKKKSL